ncbi:ADP-ribosyltransferase [Nocardia sp. NPDC046473]|uniref:WXG100-like domain-containing protein n=1 Tax=Nocardia sp. NPDC046473 TaxID=3155733 RepID=UPI0033F58E3C
MSIEMPAGLQWLTIFAGSNWPKGDEDAMFSLDGSYHTAAEELEAEIAQLRAACDKALANYSGPASDQMKRQFDLFFTGDTAVANQVKSLRKLGTAAHEMGVSIEHAKLQIIITLALLAAEIAYLLTTWFGAAMVPVAEAEAQIAIAGFGRAMLARLSQHAAWMAKLPMWKLAGISGLVQGGLGLLTEVAVEGIQKDKGHISSFDLKQIFVAGATGAAGGAVGAPVGSIIGKRFGNWVGQESMTTLKATGIAFVSGVGGGLAGVGAGFVAGGALTGEWDFDPVMLAGGAAGGALGAMHGAVGHLNAAALNKTHGAAGEQKPISLYSNDAKFSDGSSITSGSDRSDGAGGGGSEATNSRGAADRPGSTGVGSISAKSLLPGRSGSVDGRYGDGSASTISASSTPNGTSRPNGTSTLNGTSTPNGNGAQQSSSAPPPVTRGVEVKPEPAISSPGPQGSQATVNHSDGVSRNGGSVGPDTHSSGGSVSRHPGEFTPAESHTRPAGEFDSRGPVSNGSESHGSTQHEPPPSQAESRPSSKASSIDSGSDSQSRGRSTDGVSGNGSRVGSEISTRPSTPEVEPVRGRSGAPITSASDGGSQARITAAHNESGPVGQRPVVAREDQSPVSSRAVSPERAVGPAAGPPRPESPAGHSGSGSEAGSIHTNRSSGDDARAHSETVVPERKHGTDEPDDRSIRRPRVHLSETKDGPALSEQPHRRAAELPTDSLAEANERPRATEAGDDLSPPVRQAAEEPMDRREVDARRGLRESDDIRNNPEVIAARDKVKVAEAEFEDSRRLVDHGETPKEGAPAATFREMREEAESRLEAARTEHDAALDRAVDERYHELEGKARDDIVVDDAHNAAVYTRTEERLTREIESFRETQQRWEKSQDALNVAAANHEARANKELVGSIQKAHGRVMETNQGLVQARREYNAEVRGSEPRADHLEGLRRDIDARAHQLRTELVEREALLQAAAKHTAELNAARAERFAIDPNEKPSAASRLIRWLQSDSTGNGATGRVVGDPRRFEADVAQRVRSLREEFGERDSTARAGASLAELKHQLDIDTAAYRAARDQLATVGKEVIRERKEILDNAGAADRAAFDAGFAKRRPALDAIAQKRVAATADLLAAVSSYEHEVLSPNRPDDPVAVPPSGERLREVIADGEPHERLAHMRTFVRMAHPEGWIPRKNQMEGFLLQVANMGTGTGKELLMAMRLVTDAIEHKTAYATTSTDNLASGMVDLVKAFTNSPLGDLGVSVSRMTEDGPMPTGGVIIGTKADFEFAALRKTQGVLDQITAAGAPPKEVNELRDWLNNERPKLDEMKHKLDSVLEKYKINEKFEPFPKGKYTGDEFDVLFDGQEAVLTPGGAEDENPAVVQHLEKVLYQVLASAKLHDLTAADFGKPDGTRGMWRATLTETALEKLNRVGGDPVHLGDAELYQNAALAVWGRRRNTDWIKSFDPNNPKDPGRTGLLASDTNDKLMVDRTKGTGEVRENRLQGVGQFLDILAGVPVRANHPEGTLYLGFGQLVGSSYLHSPSGVSATLKHVENALYDQHGVGPVPQVESFYRDRTESRDRNFDTRELKLEAEGERFVTNLIAPDGKIELITDNNGTVTGAKQRGRPVWMVQTDNRDIAGDDVRIVRGDDGRVVEEIALHTWKDKELKEYGVVDWIDKITEELVHAEAKAAGLPVAEKIKLDYTVRDARWYEKHGNGVEAEQLANQQTKEWGAPGSAHIGNKDDARGKSPIPTPESVELDGTLVLSSGGPGLGEINYVQIRGRASRGGSGPDRKNGGFPGTFERFISPGDYDGPVADHGVREQVIRYQNSAKEHREAFAAHETHNTPETQARMDSTEHALQQAEQNLRENVAPALQKSVDEHMLLPKHGAAYHANAPPLAGLSALDGLGLAPPGMDFTTPPPAVQLPEQQTVTPEPDRNDGSVDTPGDAGMHHDTDTDDGANTHGDNNTHYDSSTNNSDTHSDTSSHYDSDFTTDVHSDTHDDAPGDARKVPPTEVAPRLVQEFADTRNDGNSAVTARRSPPHTSPFDGSADSLSRNGSGTFGRSGLSGQSVSEPPVGKTDLGPHLDKFFDAADAYSAARPKGLAHQNFGNGRDGAQNLTEIFDDDGPRIGLGPEPTDVTGPPPAQSSLSNGQPAIPPTTPGRVWAVARAAAQFDDIFDQPLQLNQLYTELRTMWPDLSFDDLQELRSHTYRNNGLRPPTVSRENLDNFLQILWDGREFVVNENKIYEAYLTLGAGDPPADAGAFKNDMVQILAQRPPGRAQRGDMEEVGVLTPHNAGNWTPEDIPVVHFARNSSRNVHSHDIKFKIYVNATGRARSTVTGHLVHYVLDNPRDFPGVYEVKAFGPQELRVDGIVVYVGDQAAADRVIGWLREYQNHFPDQFHWGAPTGSEQVLSGVGLGAEPRNDSFGRTRAKALFTALDLHRNATFDDFAAEVRNQYRARGIDPERVHLNLAPATDGSTAHQGSTSIGVGEHAGGTTALVSYQEPITINQCIPRNLTGFTDLTGSTYTTIPAFTGPSGHSFQAAKVFIGTPVHKVGNYARVTDLLRVHKPAAAVIIDIYKTPIGKYNIGGHLFYAAVDEDGVFTVTDHERGKTYRALPEPPHELDTVYISLVTLDGGHPIQFTLDTGSSSSESPSRATSPDHEEVLLALGPDQRSRGSGAAEITNALPVTDGSYLTPQPWEDQTLPDDPSHYLGLDDYLDTEPVTFIEYGMEEFVETYSAVDWPLHIGVRFQEPGNNHRGFAARFTGPYVEMTNDNDKTHTLRTAVFWSQLRNMSRNNWTVSTLESAHREDFASYVETTDKILDAVARHDLPTGTTLTWRSDQERITTAEVLADGVFGLRGGSDDGIFDPVVTIAAETLSHHLERIGAVKITPPQHAPPHPVPLVVASPAHTPASKDTDTVAGPSTGRPGPSATGVAFPHAVNRTLFALGKVYSDNNLRQMADESFKVVVENLKRQGMDVSEKELAYASRHIFKRYPHIGDEDCILDSNRKLSHLATAFHLAATSGLIPNKHPEPRPDPSEIRAEAVRYLVEQDRAGHGGRVTDRKMYQAIRADRSEVGLDISGRIRDILFGAIMDLDIPREHWVYKNDRLDRKATIITHVRQSEASRDLLWPGSSGEGSYGLSADSDGSAAHARPTQIGASEHENDCGPALLTHLDTHAPDSARIDHDSLPRGPAGVTHHDIEHHTLTPHTPRRIGLNDNNRERSADGASEQPVMMPDIPSIVVTPPAEDAANGVTPLHGAGVLSGEELYFGEFLTEVLGGARFGGSEASIFDGPEDYVLPGLFDEPRHVFEPAEGETYFGALRETIEAGEVTFLGGLSPALQNFGSRREGLQNLVHMLPVPHDQMEMLQDHVIRMVEEHFGPDPAFAATVMPALETAVKKFSQLLSESGEPLSAPHLGNRYPAFLRLSPRVVRRSDDQMAPVGDGPPVGNQRYDSGSTEHGNKHSTANLRSGAYSYAHGWPVRLGVLRRVGLTGQLAAEYHRLSTNMTVDTTLQVTAKLRSLGPSELYDLLGEWQIRLGHGWHDVFRVRTDDWATVLTAPLQAQFPLYMTRSGELPAINPADAATIPAPIERLQREFPLHGVLGIPHIDQLRADTFASFGSYFSDLDTDSREVLLKFFEEEQFCDNFPKMWGDSAPHTDAQDPGFGFSSPILRTNSGEPGYLHIVVEANGGTEIAGPTAKQSRLESYLVRQVGLHGSSTITEMLGASLAWTLEFGADAIAEDTGHAPPSGRITFRGGASREFSHGLSHQNDAQKQHSLRLAGNDFHNVMTMFTFHVTLVRPFGPPVAPAIGTPLHGGNDYSVRMLVPSLQDLGHAPTKTLYPTSNVVHLRQYGMNTTPLGVDGAAGLIAQARQRLADRGFIPSANNTAGPLSWLTHNATVEQQLDNRRKFDDMFGPTGLKSAQPGAIEGGVIEWFTLKTPTGVRRFGIEFVTERHYPSDDPYDGASHDWTYDEAQTYNVTGSAMSGGEEFSAASPWENYHGGFNVAVNTPIVGVTGVYDHSRKNKRIRGSGSGFGEQKFTLSSPGLEVVTLSAVHKVRFIERAVPDETITAIGNVRVAIPSDDMLTERPAAAPRPPATIRELAAADTRRLAMPTGGRTLEDGVLRVPDGAVVQHFIVSKELRKAATGAISDLRNYYLNYVRTASAAALSDLRDHFQQAEGPDQTMPGAYLADPMDEQPPPEPFVGAEIEVLSSAPEDVLEQQPRPAQPQEHEPQPEPGDTPTQQEQHDIARDTRTEPSMPGAFPADHLEIEAEPAPQVNWPAVGQALLGKAEWVVDRVTGVGQWVWRHALGEPATDPWSKVAEATHAAFSTEQMMANALPILQDSLTGEGLFSDGVLAGTSYRWRVRAILTEPRYLGRRKKNLESWAKRESKFQRSQARQRGHRFGVTPSGRPDGSADGSVVPAGSYQYGWTDEDHITASDSMYSSRVRNSNELVHLWGGDLTVVLEFESGTRNPLVNMLPGGPRTVTRVFDVPDGVEFFLDNHDLQDIPELAAIVHASSDYRIPPAPEPDRTLPLSFLETGGHLGYGAVVKATIRPDDDTASSRDVLKNLVMEHVTQLAAGAGQINSSNYLPFLESVMNMLGTTFGLRTLVYDGPDSRITFGFISRDWPYSALPSLVTFTLSARLDPDVDLGAVLGREVTHPSALDTMLGTTGADSSALPIAGATGIGKKRVKSHQATFNPSLNNEVKTSFSFTGEQQAIQSNERTSDTGVASWTQSSGRLRQFPVRYQLEVEVSRRLLTANLKKTLLSTGADIEAFFGRENGIFALNEAELPPPANTVRGSVGLDTLLWFHTSETGNGALTPRIPPSIYGSDPTVPRQAAPPGTIALDMEIPAELRALVSTAPWVPTNEISLNYFSGARQIADALRQVDPSLRRTDPTRSTGQQTYSSVGVFNLLKQLAATNQLTRLGPAATAAFLGTSGRSDQVPRPQPHAEGESVTGTFVKFTIYAPQIDSTSRDIAVHHKRTRKTGEKSTAGHGFGFRPTIGLTNAFTADSTNQGNPSNVPIGGYLEIVEQVSDTVRQDDDLLRQGTTAETATGEGRDSNLFVGVGVAEIVGRRGRLWVPGIVRGYTTALLEAHALGEQIGPPRPPALPAPAVLAGTRRPSTYGMGRMGSVVALPHSRPSVSADGSSAKPAAAVPVQALPPSGDTTIPAQGVGALDNQPDAEAQQQHSEPVPESEPTGTTDSPDLGTDPAGTETVVPAPESEHQLTQITEVDTHSGTQHDGALDNSAEPGAVDQVDESENLARVEEWQRGMLDVLSAGERLGETSRDDAVHEPDLDQPRAPPTDVVRSSSPTGTVESSGTVQHAPLPEHESTDTEHREPPASPRTPIEDADLVRRQREVEQLTDLVGPLDRRETRGPASLSDRFSSPPRSDDGSVYSDPDRTHDTPLLGTDQTAPAIPFRLADTRSQLRLDDDSEDGSDDQEPLQHIKTTPDDSAAPRDERTSGTDELNRRDPVPAASDDQIGSTPHTGDDLAPLPQPRDGTTSTTEHRDLSTSGIDSSAPVRTSDTPHEQPARRQRTRERLRGFISRISHATDNATTTPAPPHTSSTTPTPRRGIRAALQRIMPETVGSTTLPAARRTAVPAHGDGTTTHTPVTTHSLEPSDECLPDTLADIQHDTNSTAIRPHYRSKGLFGRFGRGLPGRSRREAEKAAGAKLRGYADEHQIAKELQILGPGAQALVVSEHATRTANRIGAHAYRMVNDRGVIFIRDATNPAHRYPGDTRAKGFHAVLYTPTGKPTRPLRLLNGTISDFPRDIRIGAPDDSGFTQQRGFSSAHQNPPGASARSAVLGNVRIGANNRNDAFADRPDSIMNSAPGEHTGSSGPAPRASGSGSLTTHVRSGLPYTAVSSPRYTDVPEPADAATSVDDRLRTQLEGESPAEPVRGMDRRPTQPFEPEGEDTYFGAALLKDLEHHLEGPTDPLRTHVDDTEDEPPVLTPEVKRQARAAIGAPVTVRRSTFADGSDAFVLIDHRGTVTRLPAAGSRRATLFNDPGARPYFRVEEPDGTHTDVDLALTKGFDFARDEPVPGATQSWVRPTGTLRWTRQDDAVRVLGRDENNAVEYLAVRDGETVVVKPENSSQHLIKKPRVPGWYRVNGLRTVIAIPRLVDRKDSPMYGPRGLRAQDARQGQAADCAFLASLRHIAERNPSAIVDMVHIHKEDKNFVSVRFYTMGKRRWVTVDTRLYVPEGSDLACFAAHRPGEPLWAALIEKAHTRAFGGDDGYHSYASGGYGSEIAERLGKGFYRDEKGWRQQPVSSVTDGGFLSPMRLDIDELHELFGGDLEFSREVADTYDRWEQGRRPILQTERNRINAVHKNDAAAANAAWAQFHLTVQFNIHRSFLEDLDKRFPGRWKNEKAAFTDYFVEMYGGEAADRTLTDHHYTITAPAFVDRIRYALGKPGTTVTLGTHPFGQGSENRTMVPGLIGGHEYDLLGIYVDKNGRPWVLADNPWDDNGRYPLPIEGVEYRLDPKGLDYTTDTSGPEYSVKPDYTRYRIDPDRTEHGIKSDGTRYRIDPDGTEYGLTPVAPDKLADFAPQIRKDIQYRIDPDGTEYGINPDMTRYVINPDNSRAAVLADGSHYRVSADQTQYLTTADGTALILRPGDPDWSRDPGRIDPPDITIPRRGGIVAIDLQHIPKFATLAVSGPGAHGLYGPDDVVRTKTGPTATPRGTHGPYGPERRSLSGPAAAARSVADIISPYARALSAVLGGPGPVDFAQVLTILRHTNAAQDARPLEAAFGGTLRDIVREALAQKRFPETQALRMARLLGWEPAEELPADVPAPPSVAVLPGATPEQLPQVEQYARAVWNETRAEAALALTARLDRDLPTLWAVRDAYRQQPGRRELIADLRRAFPGEREYIDHVFAEPSAKLAAGEPDAVPTPVQEDTALDWIRALGDMPFENRTGSQAHLDAGSAERAHLMALALVRWGAHPRRITVSGEGMRITRTLPDGSRHEVPVQRYVANLVYTVQGGTPGWQVFDPALGRTPLREQEVRIALNASRAPPRGQSGTPTTVTIETSEILTPDALEEFDRELRRPEPRASDASTAQQHSQRASRDTAVTNPVGARGFSALPSTGAVGRPDGVLDEEYWVIHGIAKGYTNGEIQELLGHNGFPHLSAAGVSSRVKSLYASAGITSQARDGEMRLREAFIESYRESINQETLDGLPLRLSKLDTDVFEYVFRNPGRRVSNVDFYQEVGTALAVSSKTVRRSMMSILARVGISSDKWIRDERRRKNLGQTFIALASSLEGRIDPEALAEFRSSGGARQWRASPLPSRMRVVDEGPGDGSSVHPGGIPGSGPVGPVISGSGPRDGSPVRMSRGDCGPLALEFAARLNPGARIRLSGASGGLSGMTGPQFEFDARARLQHVDTLGPVIGLLRTFGHRSLSLVVGKHASVDARGFGAHSGVMYSWDGMLRIYDPETGVDHPLEHHSFPEVRAWLVIIYGPDGSPQTIAGYPYDGAAVLGDALIGAPPTDYQVDFETLELSPEFFWSGNGAGFYDLPIASFIDLFDAGGMLRLTAVEGGFTVQYHQVGGPGGVLPGPVLDSASTLELIRGRYNTHAVTRTVLHRPHRDLFDGVRVFDSDNAGAAYGRRRLRIWRDLPREQKVALRAYQERQLVNSRLRLYQNDDRGFDRFCNGFRRDADIANRIIRVHGTIPDLTAVQNRCYDLNAAARRSRSEALELEALDEILAHPYPHMYRDQLLAAPEILRSMDDYCQRYFGVPFSSNIIRRQIELLDRATDRELPLTEPIRVVRSLQDINFLVDWHGNTMSGQSDLSVLLNVTQQEPGFMSTSVSARTVDLHHATNYRLELVLYPGTRGVYIGQDGGEEFAHQNELLLARDTRYVITGYGYDRSDPNVVVLYGYVVRAAVHTGPHTSR